MARKSRQAAQLASCAQAEGQALVNQAKQYRTAIYARLSVYDLGRDDSDTMDNQIELLRQYISRQPDLILTGIYIDNGWSGTTFQRPQFQSMLEDIRKGRINCVIVKDLSRFGRNYIDAGYYLQELFPLFQVRFISVNDTYDSLTSDPESMAVSMKSIINAYYSKDISRKVSASLDIKRKTGSHAWGHPPYGYIRSPEDPAHWIKDPEVSTYVDMMFRWALDGLPLKRIASNLTDQGAPTYQRLVYLRSSGKTRRTGSDAWSSSSVRFMLTNQCYTGDFVYNKTYTRKYDPGSVKIIPREDWITISDSHPAYISHEDFALIQHMIELRKNKHAKNMDRREVLRSAYPDRYRNLLFCGVCHRRMRMRQDFEGYVYTGYTCPGTEDQFHTGHRCFTWNVKTLDEIVSQQLAVQINLAVEIDAFFNRPTLRNEAEHCRKRLAARIRILKEKLTQIKNARSEAYEDLVDGISDANTYQARISQLLQDQDAVVDAIREAENRSTHADEFFSSEHPWVQILVQMTGDTQLDAQLIGQLIERIELYPDKHIEIVYRYRDHLRSLYDCIGDSLK